MPCFIAPRSRQLKMISSLRTRWPRVSSALSLFALLPVLTSCALMAPRTPEEAVRDRAQARWNALLAGKFDEAYAFLSPASRGVVSAQRFRAGIGGAASWKSAQVHSVTCPDADRCIVIIKVSYEAALPRVRLGTIESGVEETWLLDAGQWWLPQER